MKKTWGFIATLALSAVLLMACSEDAADEPAEAKAAITVAGDTVSKLGGCVLANQFAEGDDIIFRMNAMDATTGEQVPDAKLVVHLSTGEELEMAYGEHGEDNFWVVAYPITADTPRGQLNYSVTADLDGATAEYKPFNVEPSLLTVIDADGSAPAEEEKEPEEEKPVDAANVNVQQKFTVTSTNFEFKNDEGEKVFYVKAGEEVTIDYVNEEGSHGFTIKEFDVNIKEEGKVTFTPDKAGEFDLVCNVYCGAGHESMVSKLVVVE